MAGEMGKGAEGTVHERGDGQDLLHSQALAKRLPEPAQQHATSVRVRAMERAWHTQLQERA